MTGSFCEATSCTLRERERVADAIMLLTDHRGEIVEHKARHWASITFAGTRHVLKMDFEGADAVEAGEDLVARLPDHEFAIPGRLVADAVIASVDHVSEMPAMIVTAEILMLEEE